MTVPVKRTAFDEGYKLGFADSLRLKSKSYQLSLWKALVSDKYRKEYIRGYNAGYYDAARQRRKTELQALTRNANSQSRSGVER